jgi:hypothetical protein
MPPHERISEMLRLASSDTRNFPATIFYNEGWLLRLVLDWFSRNDGDGHSLTFEPGARWFSEALLPSQFLARMRTDPLAEGWTHADGVIGQVTIGSGALANTLLSKEGSQFLVTEAKLFSPLSPGVTHAPSFDQAARNVACMAEVLCRAGRSPEQLSSLSFLLIAPEEHITNRKMFDSLLSKDSIQTKVTQRVSQYAGQPEAASKNAWLQNWFEPTLERVKIQAITWESVTKFILEKDLQFGSELSSFYIECLQFNGAQEPEIPSSASGAIADPLA